jgi:hypothetical protein
MTGAILVGVGLITAGTFVVSSNLLMQTAYTKSMLETAKIIEFPLELEIKKSSPSEDIRNSLGD